MSVNAKIGPVYDPGLCRCCGALKKCRLLNHEYNWMGQKEIYSDMFRDCFGLQLSHLDGEQLERLVCATCVSRLREANTFRQQVLRCEEQLLQVCILRGQAEDSLDTTVGSKINVNDVEDTKPCNLAENMFVTEESIPEDPVAEDSLDTSVGLKINVNDVEDTKPCNLADNMFVIEESILKDPSEDLMPPEENPKETPMPPEEKPKKTPKKKKTLKTPIKRKKKREESSEDEKDREEVLENLPRRSKRLRGMQDSDDIKQTTVKTKPMDKKQKAFFNASVLVENSYACPFDTSSSDYYCIYCREIFTDPCKLREHTLTHDPSTFKDIAVAKRKLLQIDIFRIDCRLCSNRIDNLDSFKSHITNDHGKTLFVDVTNEFLQFKLTQKSLSCLECGSSFNLFHALFKHMAYHFGTCICDECGAHYFDKKSLVLHQKSHPRIEESYACKECGKSFKSKLQRYLHIGRKHKKKEMCRCSKCGEVFSSYSLRYRHMIEAHGEKKMFSCEHCDKAYDTRTCLAGHHRRYHLKILKHQCDFCGKRFYVPSHLKQHMTVHARKKNNRCEYCRKSYLRMRDLKVHMQSQSSEK